MTATEAPVPDEVQSGVTPLELLTDDERVWTAVPADANGEEGVGEWLEIDADALCGLEEWR
ncbi:DUF7511 domain-containing protein [Natrinema halophilum]|uniref:DUF7511 domain-containing protein n=1 Tax=Natrinema halophilum TaxID=1699371 RepID=A0A7D5GK25_9EURY|nr:hypothetical protein [Natrinema halophilum]QLG51094.1 hypothetical protein HYG82_20800 [Natrinema halophilum]